MYSTIQLSRKTRSGTHTHIYTERERERRAGIQWLELSNGKAAASFPPAAQCVYYIQLNKEAGLLHSDKQEDRVYCIQLDKKAALANLSETHTVGGFANFS